MTFHAKGNNIWSFFLVTEISSFSLHKTSCKFRKNYGKIIFLPTSCVEKDLLLLPGIHNINFFFIRKIHNMNLSFLLYMNFHFVRGCFYNNLAFFQRNLCLLNILKDLLNLHYKGKYETELRNFFFTDFSMVTPWYRPMLVASKIP